MVTEIKYIYKQGLTTLLIITYPWIIIAIIAQALGSMEFEGVDIYIYASHDDLEEIKAFFPVGMNLFPVDSEEEVIENVKLGKASIGIVALRNNDGRLTVNFYQDPLKGFLSSELIARIENAFGEISRRYIDEKIVGLWSDTFDLLNELKNESEKIPILYREIENATKELKILEEEFSSVNISKMNKTLDNVSREISESSNELINLSSRIYKLRQSINQLSTYEADLNEFDEKLTITYEKIVDMRSKISVWRSKIQSATLKLDDRIDRINSYLITIAQLKQQAQEAGDITTYKYLSEVEEILISSKDELVIARDELIAADSELQQIDIKLIDALHDITNAKTKINQAKISLRSTKENAIATLNSAETSIKDFNNRLKSFNSTLFTAKKELNTISDSISTTLDFVKSSADKLLSFKEEVNKTESMLNNIILFLSEFSKKNPIEFAPPKTERTQVIKVEKIINIFLPSVTGIVVMLSCLLFPMIIAIRQRDEGIAFRYRSSTTPYSTILVGKFIGHYFVGLLQAIIIITFGLIFLDINYSDIYSLLLAILLVPLPFVAIGTLCSFFVSRESPAILTTLLLGIPMLFLSGTFIPREQIHGFPKLLSPYLPLTNVVEILNKVTIRSQPILEASLEVIYVLIVTLISLGLSYVLIKRKL